MIRPLFVFAFFAMLSWAGLGAAAPDEAITPSGATEEQAPLPTYWLRNREGWFWYQDPPPDVMKKKEAVREQDARPKELIEFEAMQKRLDELKRIAVMNPSESHMKAYMGYQRYVMDKSAVFADNWQRLV
jgi:conjugal transfer pilus assembly protein TraF